MLRADQVFRARRSFRSRGSSKPGVVAQFGAAQSNSNPKVAAANFCGHLLPRRSSHPPRCPLRAGLCSYPVSGGDVPADTGV